MYAYGVLSFYKFYYLLTVYRIFIYLLFVGFWFLFLLPTQIKRRICAGIINRFARESYKECFMHLYSKVLLGIENRVTVFNDFSSSKLLQKSVEYRWVSKVLSLLSDWEFENSNFWTWLCTAICIIPSWFSMVSFW